MDFLIVLMVLAAITTCVLWVRFINWVFAGIERILKIKSEVKTHQPNPYIEAHKFKIQNDKNYSDYIDWMSKQNLEVPISKIEMSEDFQASQKIGNLLR